MKNNILKNGLTVGLSILSSFGGMAQQNEELRPNVLFIMCDDLIDFNGIYKDYPKAITPNLDRLREKSVNFVNAHTIAPVSAPARAALFTGVYPHRSKNYGFNTWYNNPVLSKGETLFKHLQKGGYDVYATGKLLHHNRKSEYTEFGIDNYAGPLAFDGVKVACHPSVPRPYAEVGPLDGTFCSLAEVPNVPPSDNAPGYNGWYDLQRKKPFRYVNDDDRDLLRDEEHAQWVIELLDRLEKNDNGKPFFIGMGLSKPHTALIAPQKYFDMYPIEDIQLPKQQTGSDKNVGFLFENTPDSKGYSHFEALKASFPDDLDYGIRKYLQAYLASITFADDVIGSVLDALENSRFADNTIVFFISDHGYDFGQKDYFFKNSLWETSTSVPFYVYCPSRYLNNTEVEHPVSLIDIYPTINELCGLDNNTVLRPGGAELSGFSLVPFLKDGDTTTEWKGPEVALTLVGGSEDYEGSQNYCVSSKEWRYIHYENGKEELYNFVTDPNEWNNLAYDPNHEAVKKQMYDKLVEIVPQVAIPEEDVEIPEVGENILQNGDFEDTYEEGSIRLPAEWNIRQDVNVSTSVSVTSNGIGKSSSLKLGFAATATDCEASQAIQLKPGVEYGFFGYCYYSAAPSNSKTARVEITTSTGEIIESFSIPVSGTFSKDVDENDESVMRFFKFTSPEESCMVKLKSNGIDKLIRFDNLAIWEISDESGIDGLFSERFITVKGKRIYISSLVERHSVEVFSLSGKLVKKGCHQSVVDLSDLPAGVYLVSALTSEGRKVVTKCSI